MREPRKFRGLHPLVKLFGSLVLMGLLLYLGTFAIRFCMGLFVKGDDFILQLPGETRPVATEPQQPDVTAPTESQEVREVGRATVLATGDLMMHLPIVRSGKTDDGYNFDAIYDYIRDYVSQADYAVVNLETTLSGTDGKEYTGYPKFNSPDAVAKGAKSGGFDMMLTANNHCNDYGTKGILRTLEVVSGAGLDTLGTCANAGDNPYVVKDLGGIKVGMMNFTYAEIGSDPDRPVVNGLPTDSAAAGLVSAFDYAKLDAFYMEVENRISAMRAAGADAIVMFIHWGDEYATRVNSNQREIAQKLCDLGVDVIAGSHPHVVQTMELLESTQEEGHRTVVMYSMGNFLSNQRANNISLTTGQSEDSVLFSFTLVAYSDGEVVIESVHILPTWVLIRGSGNGRSYHIVPLDQNVKDWAEVYDLTGTQSRDAKESYNRTMDTLGEDYKKICQALAEAAGDRDGASVPTEPEGVG